MKRNMLLAMIASAALLIISAGSVAEASHWNRGYSREYIHHGYNGFRGNYRTNYGGHYHPVNRYNHRPYRAGNRYGNSYYSPYNYGNVGSNGAGLYFRF